MSWAVGLALSTVNLYYFIGILTYAIVCVLMELYETTLQYFIGILAYVIVYLLMDCMKQHRLNGFRSFMCTYIWP